MSEEKTKFNPFQIVGQKLMEAGIHIQLWGNMFFMLELRISATEDFNEQNVDYKVIATMYGDIIAVMPNMNDLKSNGKRTQHMKKYNITPMDMENITPENIFNMINDYYKQEVE